VFTDSAKLVITYLHKQLALLCAENRATLHLSAIPQPQFAKRFTLAKPFNIVFLDPPFRQGFIKTCCQWLEQEKLLADEAYIYIETETELTTLPVPVHWQILHSKIAGQVRYYLIKRTKE
jgi:16S rRNA (guanine966-N2)-methyltransferase